MQFILEDKENVETSNSDEEPQKPPIVKTSKKGIGPKDQLLYLSKLLNFEVVFSDYPKVSWIIKNLAKKK